MVLSIHGEDAKDRLGRIGLQPTTAEERCTQFRIALCFLAWFFSSLAASALCVALTWGPVWSGEMAASIVLFTLFLVPTCLLLALSIKVIRSNFSGWGKARSGKIVGRNVGELNLTDKISAAASYIFEFVVVPLLVSALSGVISCAVLKLIVFIIDPRVSGVIAVYVIVFCMMVISALVGILSVRLWGRYVLRDTERMLLDEVAEYDSPDCEISGEISCCAGFGWRDYAALISCLDEADAIRKREQKKCGIPEGLIRGSKDKNPYATACFRAKYVVAGEEKELYISMTHFRKYKYNPGNVDKVKIIASDDIADVDLPSEDIKSLSRQYGMLIRIFRLI